MDSLHEKVALVLTNSGAAVSIGRFFISPSTLPNQPNRLELVFETPSMKCRLRVPQEKVAEIQASWNGEAYTYRLPSGDSVWLPHADRDTKALPDSPQIETFPPPSKKK